MRSVHLKLSQQAAILIAVPLIFEIIFVAALSHLLNAAETEAREQSRAKNLVAQSNELAGLCQDASILLYLYSQSKSSMIHEHLQTVLQQIPAEVALLKTLSSHDPKEEQSLQQLEKSVNESLLMLQWFHHRIQHDDSTGLVAARKRIIGTFGHLMKSVHGMAETASRAQMDSTVQSRLRLYIQYVLVAGVSFNVFLAIALAYLFYRGTTGRLSTLMQNSARLAAGQSLMPQLGGDDELGRLDRVFHSMAASLKEAQRKEHAVIDYAHDVICSLDADKKFAAINPAARTVLGYEPGELAGTAVTDLAPEEDRQSFLRDLDDIITGQSTHSFESRVTRKDGSLADIRWSAHWSNEEQSLFCVAHDISDRKEVERLKQEFVQMISHDLRTPLMSVQADLSILSAGVAGELPERAVKNVTDAERNIEYVISLINSLLDIEKMSAGRLELYPALISLQSTVTRAVEAVNALARNKELTITTEAEPVEVFADPDRLVQVVINLLSNAVKFSPAQAKIAVIVRDLGDQAEVRVVDEGRGIPEGQRQNIFKRFHQVAPGDSKVHGGTGLGLAICKAIVEEHQGEIGVESEEGKGSEFWFRLPKVTAQERENYPEGSQK